MKTIRAILGVVAAFFLAAPALAQPAPPPGPWLYAAPQIYAPAGSCVTMPQTVTGGCEGSNTFNIGGGYYINGVLIGSVATTRAISAPYTIGQSGNNDCGLTLVATGGSFYAVSQSGSYLAGCKIVILNNDPIPTGSNSTGAKFVNFVNCNPSESGTYLWPRQTIEVTYINSTWIPTRCPGLWQVPNGIFTFNVDPTNGSDTWGAADGLALTTRAFASVANALGVAVETIQEGFLNQTILTAKLCAGCTDSAEIHWPSHGGAPLGAQGGSGTTVDCNGGTLSGGVQLFFQSTLQFQNCTFTGPVSAIQGAVFVCGAGANTLSGALFQLSQGAQARCNGQTINVTGSFFDIFQISSGASIVGVSINQIGNVTYSDVGIRVQSAGFVSISAWTTNGFSATGTKYALIECGVMEGSSLVAGSVAGSASCTQAN